LKNVREMLLFEIGNHEISYVGFSTLMCIKNRGERQKENVKVNLLLLISFGGTCLLAIIMTADYFFRLFFNQE
jgi:hypothetical protein